MTKPTPHLDPRTRHPEFIAADERFAQLAHEAGPLGDRERRLA